MKVKDLLIRIFEISLARVYNEAIEKSGLEAISEEVIKEDARSFINSLSELEVYPQYICGTVVLPELNIPEIIEETEKEVNDGIWVYDCTGHSGDFCIVHCTDMEIAKKIAKENKRCPITTDVIIVWDKHYIIVK